MNSEEFFKFVNKCQRNHDKPDKHSFSVKIKEGIAYVVGRFDGVFVEYYIGDKKHQIIGTAIAMANKLDMLEADYSTIDM